MKIKKIDNLAGAEMNKNILGKEGTSLIIKSTGAAPYLGGGANQEILVSESKTNKALKILKNA